MSHHLFPEGYKLKNWNEKIGHNKKVAIKASIMVLEMVLSSLDDVKHLKVVSKFRIMELVLASPFMHNVCLCASLEEE